GTTNLQTALDSYVALYSQALVLDESICLCAIMGAEAIGLPKNVNQKTKTFFKMNRTWLLDLFQRHGVQNAEDTSCLIVAALEGGMIVASTSDDRSLFDQIAKAALRSIAKI
ncbi:MAG: TetR/AcrR family transcriptional repressor of nem operon, partial [Glaciecola sp.]